MVLIIYWLEDMLLFCITAMAEVTGDMDLWINQTVENYNKLQLVYKDFLSAYFFN